MTSRRGFFRFLGLAAVASASGATLRPTAATAALPEIGYVPVPVDVLLQFSIEGRREKALCLFQNRTIGGDHPFTCMRKGAGCERSQELVLGESEWRCPCGQYVQPLGESEA